MDANFLHPSARRRKITAGVAPDDVASVPGRAVGPAGRACCCAAKAAVKVIMPSASARPDPTDLLLCAHHYRASRHALAAAGATIRELPGTPGDIASWIGIDG
jgi:hypothetical protein